MPTRRQAARVATHGPGLSGPHLTYQGGPVVTNAHVRSVLWGSGTYLPQEDGSTTPNTDTFFAHVGNSAYLAWLNGEYHTPSSGGTNQSIGYASYLGRSTITPANSATTVSDATIQTELVNQINAGHLPAPVGDGAGHTNTVYAVYFASGTTICIQQNECSGQLFCAYHSSTNATIGGLHLLYMVLPYPDANMISGCGNLSAFNTLSEYTAHELIETITDPEVASNVVSWYDNSNGEIADICDGQGSTVTGTDTTTYEVQKVWSNAQNACLAQKSSSAPDAPASPAAHALSGGRIALSWAAPGNDGGTGITRYDVYRSTVSGSRGSLAASVTPPSLSWTSGALPNGQTQYLQVVAHNVAGDSTPSTQVSATADSVAPTTTVTAPTSLFQLSNTVHVVYSAPGAASYDVQSRSAAWNGAFTAYSTIGSATSATSRSITGSSGHEYCFRVRARDSAGNVSAWSHDRCTAIPLDDRALSTATTGWSRISSAGAYRGTLTKTTQGGAALKLTSARADRLALVMTTCPSCGTVGVYLNGTLWHTVNTHAPAVHAQTIALPGTFSLRTTTITLKNATAGKQLLVDGLGVAQT